MEDTWRILGRGTSNGGFVVCIIIKPKLGLRPKLFGEACYVFLLGGDFIENDEPEGNQGFCQMQECIPEVVKARSAVIKETGSSKLFSANGHGAVTSPQTQSGYTAFVHTKLSHVIGASCIHTGTMSLGKMEGDSSDKIKAFMPRSDAADGQYYHQEWEGTRQTTPFISGGMHALHLYSFFENLSHSNVILTADGGAMGHKDSPKPGAVSCRQGGEAWKKRKSGHFGDVSPSHGIVEYAKAHEQIKGRSTFQKDADQTLHRITADMEQEATGVIAETSSLPAQTANDFD